MDSTEAKYQIKRAIAQLKSAAYDELDKKLVILSVIAQLQAYLDANKTHKNILIFIIFLYKHMYNYI